MHERSACAGTVSRNPNFRGRHPSRQVPFLLPRGTMPDWQKPLADQCTAPGQCSAVKDFAVGSIVAARAEKTRGVGVEPTSIDRLRDQSSYRSSTPRGANDRAPHSGFPATLHGAAIVLRPGEYHRVTSAHPKYHFACAFGRRKNRWPQPEIGRSRVTRRQMIGATPARDPFVDGPILPTFPVGCASL